MLAGWSRSHLPSCSPAQGSSVILTARQMAFLKLICFLAWVGIFLNLSNLISSFQSHQHHQAVQPFLVWKIPRHQPCPTPKQNKTNILKHRGIAPCSFTLPRAPRSCTATPGCTPRTRGAPKPGTALGLLRQMPTHHSLNSCRDRVTTAGFQMFPPARALLHPPSHARVGGASREPHPGNILLHT